MDFKLLRRRGARCSSRTGLPMMYDYPYAMFKDGRLILSEGARQKPQDGQQKAQE